MKTFEIFNIFDTFRILKYFQIFLRKCIAAAALEKRKCFGAALLAIANQLLNSLNHDIYFVDYEEHFSSPQTT